MFSDKKHLFDSSKINDKTNLESQKRRHYQLRNNVSQTTGSDELWREIVALINSYRKNYQIISGDLFPLELLEKLSN